MVILVRNLRVLTLVRIMVFVLKESVSANQAFQGTLVLKEHAQIVAQATEFANKAYVHVSWAGAVTTV